MNGESATIGYYIYPNERREEVTMAANAVYSGIVAESGVVFGYGDAGRYREFYFIWFGLPGDVPGFSTQPRMWDIHDHADLLWHLIDKGKLKNYPHDMWDEIARTIWCRCADNYCWLPARKKVEKDLKRYKRKDPRRDIVVTYHWDRLHYMKPEYLKGHYDGT